jgi:hypothetical protein
LPPDELAQARLELHPSASWIASRFPIVSVWHDNATQSNGTIDCWRAETALIVRPEAEVGVYLLPDGGADFIDAIAAGRTVGEAAAAAMARVVGLDLGGLFACLINSGAVTHIRLKPAATPL